ncbi:hypothetical protein BH11MYX2_BH11MYX2_11190 [soil metagenome]
MAGVAHTIAIGIGGRSVEMLARCAIRSECGGLELAAQTLRVDGIRSRIARSSIGTFVAGLGGMKLAPLAVVAIACSAPAPSPSPSLPWVSGLTTTATADVEVPSIGDRLAGAVGEHDAAGYGGIAVPIEQGTVLASYHLGVAIVDTNGRVIARAPGFAAEGSADDLVSVTVGDAQLDQPVIMLAVARGGHRENTTWIAVYQINQGRLAQVFSAPVEEHDGDQTLVGAITFVPHGLVYQRPNGERELWTFDASRSRYVPTTSHPEKRTRSSSPSVMTSPHPRST